MDLRLYGATTCIALRIKLDHYPQSWPCGVPMKLMTLALFSAGLAFSQSKECDAPEQCRSILESNPKSSIAHYRMGEWFFLHDNFQSGANELSAALMGDLDPKWTEVWAHLILGKIFDATDQRDRAVNQYRLALRAGDNTRGAMDEAAKYIQSPYRRGTH
jgi:tetratricopeptide (TPR) repeat protein